MARDDEPFLSRWARRKQKQRRPSEGAPADDGGGNQASPKAAENTQGTEAAEAEAEAERQRMIDELPEPETLSEQDDFTQFMQDGVPDDLRNRALRQLWRSNPIYAVRDGLNDYDLDYTDAANVVKNLKTIYQVGRGMLSDEERKAEAAGAADGAPATPAPEEESAGAETAEDLESPTQAGEAAGGVAGSDEAEETQQRPPRRVAAGQDAAYRARGEAKPGAQRTRSKGRAAQRRWGGSEG